MNFVDYAEAIWPTCQLSDEDLNEYIMLGLVGEAGEVCDVLKKSIRDDGGELTPARRDHLIEELGDVCWYLAINGRRRGMKFHIVNNGGGPEQIDPYQVALSMSSAVLIVSATCLEWDGSAPQVIELADRTASALSHVSTILMWANSSIEEAMERNVAKVRARYLVN